jgi:hypothetical protein
LLLLRWKIKEKLKQVQERGSATPSLTISDASKEVIAIAVSFLASFKYPILARVIAVFKETDWLTNFAEEV